MSLESLFGFGKKDPRQEAVDEGMRAQARRIREDLEEGRARMAQSGAKEASFNSDDEQYHPPAHT